MMSRTAGLGLVLAMALPNVGSAEIKVGTVYLPVGVATRIGSCVVDVHHTCVGASGPLIALAPVCDEDPEDAARGLGMGLLEGQCFQLEDGAYCIESIDLDRGASATKRVAHGRVDHALLQ